MKKININSEVKRLKTVLVHRPGLELANLTPRYLQEQLFDDIPWLEEAQREHDEFVHILQAHGVEVVYLVDLAADSILNPQVKNKFIEQFIFEANVDNPTTKKQLRAFLHELAPHDLIRSTMAGIRKDQLPNYKKVSLSAFIEDYPFISDPMPNLYFTRDCASVIGQDISINRMRNEVRRRETIYTDFIFKYHPEYAVEDLLYERGEYSSIEGGDILIVDAQTVLIGVSERTEPDAIETLAKRLLARGQWQCVIAINLPKERTFMHLDTVLTQVDDQRFVAHHALIKNVTHYVITPAVRKNHVRIDEVKERLTKTLSRVLKKPISFIPCGGKDTIASDREQWNDGANTLAIEPGKVLVYARNTITNEILQANGIKTIALRSSELARGRGGPHCMSMPLKRREN